jgi:hypothetical protein
MDSGFEPPKIKLVGDARLAWKDQDVSGVFFSGWRPLKGLTFALKDEAKTNQSVMIAIEPPAPGAGICCMMFCVPFFPFFWPLMVYIYLFVFCLDIRMHLDMYMQIIYQCLIP